MEFSNLFIEPTRCEKKVEVQQDLTYSPLGVRCLTDCGGNELLLITFVVSLSGGATDGL